jgi:hypothetical protein
VFRTLINGEELLVASRDDKAHAVQLLASLKQCWPGDYSVKEEDDKDGIPTGVEKAVAFGVGWGNERNN